MAKKITDENLIMLVKLYNRLSYYFCMADTTQEVNLGNRTIDELLAELNRIYDENEAKKTKNKKLKIKDEGCE